MSSEPGCRISGFARRGGATDDHRALLERRARLQARAGKPRARKGLRENLERNVWPMIPSAELGRVLNREEEDQILGYGPEGY